MRWGRVYFAVQALAGAAWWVAVFAAPEVREATLGSLDPVTVAALDIPLFVVGSALAAAGLRSAAFVATGWTVLVAGALALYATATTEAGWGVLVMAVPGEASPPSAQRTRTTHLSEIRSSSWRLGHTARNALYSTVACAFF